MEGFISNFLFSNLFVYFMKFMSSQAISKAVRIQYFFCSASSRIQTGYGRQRCIQKSKMERSAKIVNDLPLNTITAYIARALEEKDQNFNGRKNNVFPIFIHHDWRHYVKRKLVKCNKARLTRYIFLSWPANQFHSKVTCEKIA